MVGDEINDEVGESGLESEHEKNSAVDIADKHSGAKHKPLWAKCIKRPCETEDDFREKFGVLPEKECDFTEAYNGLITEKGEQIRTYVIKDTLWIVDEDHCDSDSHELNIMLVIYVISAHCAHRYDHITSIGFWRKPNMSRWHFYIAGHVILMKVADIPMATLRTVSYDYIGYIKKGKIWRDAEEPDFQEMAADESAPNASGAIDQKLLVPINSQSKYSLVNQADKLLAVPVKFGGGEFEKVSIDYISDIHIEHHVNTGESVHVQVRKIAKTLFESQKSEYVFFGGDIADDRRLCALFYKEYILYGKYTEYKKWKRTNEFRPALSDEEAEKTYRQQLEKYQLKYEKQKYRLKPWLKYTKKYADKTYGQIVESKVFESKGYPDFVKILLRKVKNLESILADYIDSRESILEKLKQGKGEKIFSKKSEGIVFAVLGNHEMSDFDTVEEATSFYSSLFRHLGICFLNNRSCEIWNLIIFGGCGFAKYNPVYNADTILNAKRFTRKDEIQETDRFEEAYKTALAYAKGVGKPLLVLAHFPINDWLKNEYCDSQAIYFTGHTHQNMRERSERRVIYADNQVGYRDNPILFKTAELGTVPNPFYDYEDGCYEISARQYGSYYEYAGDPISGMFPIEKTVNNGGRMLMIKHAGFYGFFVQNKARDIYICEGGKKKKIPEVRDIGQVIDNFDAMASLYLKALFSFRKAEEAISKELQTIGLSGRIHGCIIDAIEPYYHIMFNPFDGDITYYFSPVFGIAQDLGSFSKMLEHAKDNNPWMIDIDKAQSQYLKLNEHKCQLAETSFEISDEMDELVALDISKSIYPFSTQIYRLQRIFTARVLRTWNQDLLEEYLEELE